MQFACLVATLDKVMTPANYAHMEKLAERLAHGLAKGHRPPRRALARRPRRRAGRIHLRPRPADERDRGGNAHQPRVEAAIHTALINRGTLIAPFHNMMLVSPATKKGQVDRLIASFDAILTDLLKAN
jgi:glutamate-1-semialdehyde 2,1-aminomutase